MIDVLVIGGGISGLSAAYEAHRAGKSVLVLEGSERWGGVLRSRLEENYVLEEGAESMLANKVAGRQLCEDLGIGEHLISTQPQYRSTLVVHDGKLVPIPAGFRMLAPQLIWPFLRSPLFSWWGKLRALGELFVPVRSMTEDESLADFVRRRLGREVLERMAQPLAAGIYTADPETLSMRATMPQFVEMERRFGSVIRGLRKTTPKGEAASGPRNALFQTLRDGMGELPRRLVEVLGEKATRLNARVDSVSREDGGWNVIVSGERLRARDLVIALGAPQAAALCRTWAPELAQELSTIKYLSSATVNLCYPLDAVTSSMIAYGFVVPHREKFDILACTYSHRKYAGRCSPKEALLRTYLGGAHNPGILDWSDEQMVEASHRDLTKLLGVKVRPTLTHVTRIPSAMPVYSVGHPGRVARIEKSCRQISHFVLTGNFLRGVGIPDCIGLARESVKRLLSIS